MRRLRDDEAQVGVGGVGVGELQVVSRDGLCGATLQTQARVAAKGGRDTVAMLDGEVDGTAAGRDPVSDDETRFSHKHINHRRFYTFSALMLLYAEVQNN